MRLANLSVFSNTQDYLPILTAALIVDMFVLTRIVAGQIRFRSLNQWYKQFGFLAVIADVLSIAIGIIISRFIYSLLFTRYHLASFLVLTCVVQLCHDLLFALFFNSIPRNKSAILDVFKDYAKEVGPKILVADALMMVSTILIASFFVTLGKNAVIVIAIVSMYILPYLLYSIR